MRRSATESKKTTRNPRDLDKGNIGKLVANDGGKKELERRLDKKREIESLTGEVHKWSGGRSIRAFNNQERGKRVQ